jgi:D-3-phosphoglycerate dehydrogenase
MVNSTFINFAKPFGLSILHGKNIITADLVKAMKEGKILGAGLDVLERNFFETLFKKIAHRSFSICTKCSQCNFDTIAGWTFESHERLAQVIVDKIKANYLGKPGLDIAEKRVSGIGGFFFKAENSKELMAWYGRHLGLK